MKIANALKKGDTIAFIAPSGCVEQDKVFNAKKYFEDKGFNIVLGKNIFNKDRYMAGTDEERLSDLHWAFGDKNIDAIICVRGGYGAIRLINKINYDIIEKNPKLFCGYSDITALSAMIYKKTGLITFSSPMPKGDFQPEEIDEYTQNYFWEAMYGKLKEITAPELKIYKSGYAEGILWGGNLSTIASLCGLDFIPNEKFIFFTEDLNEPVYKIDKYFRQLLNIQKFHNNLNAIILGDFLDAEPEELFQELAYELNIPIYGGYKISHSKTKVTIPFGINCILENGVIKF